MDFETPQAPAPAVPTPPAAGQDVDPAAQPDPSEQVAPPADDSQPPADPAEARAQELARHMAKKRIDTLLQRNTRAERALNEAILREQQAAAERDEVKRRLFEIERKQSMPRPEQFGMDADQYAKAMQEHNEATRAEEKRLEQERALEQQQLQVAQAAKRLVEQRFAEGAERYADYAEVVGNPSLPPLGRVNPPLWAAILDHPRSVDLSYYLAKNPTESFRLAQLPPHRALTALGELAKDLPGEQRRQASNAPAPPKEVGGNERAQPRRLEEIKDQREWEAEYRRRYYSKRGR